MSLVKISGNASGTGTLTIAAPNTNTNYTLTLPTNTGTINTSGGANEVPAGSVSSPSIYPTGDTNTGMFFPAADTIGFVCGGTEDFRVDGDGQLWNTVNSQVGTDYTTLYKGYLCRAWVNFNGGGVIAIVGSGNVSSITDSGTGDYIVNFTTAMPDANYIAVPASGRDQASDTGNVVAYVNTTGTVNVSTFSEGTSTRQDVSVVGVAVFR